ncbi:hypothetical protein CVV38_02315 [Candidatus Peregrinibacteria bacterium HGW-Peregrinibacteria-1]|jgi:uncharacterized metal-binding protein YceD (DUF177 family)|nr:MAG: hypothetical protein CVV38_02315 [Candidatus Peregrinibacteria bacterium HGW-Peregrinibacteria-1]
MNKTQTVPNLKFDIGELLDRLLGTSISYSFSEPSLYEDFDTQTTLDGKLDIMRIEKSLNVIIRDFETTIVFPSCSRCLQEFTLPIKIEHAERQFYIKEPQDLDDPNDFYLVDLKHQQIDISEMLRQEIILHFPTFLVCSNSCKGICDQCGNDRNQKDCDCQQIEVTNNPFSQLKELI